MLIRVGSLDPSLQNTGIVRATVNISAPVEPGLITVDGFFLSMTEPRNNKQVRKNSDDVRRAGEHLAAMRRELADCVIAFAEVPHGSQSARAMASYGICVGLLAACPVELIQVSAEEVKLAAVGTKTASKEEMIEWAGYLYPGLPWKRYEKASKKHAVGEIHEDMEHIADAIAAIHAGVKTDQFKQLMRMWRATSEAQQPQRLVAV